MIAQVSTAAVYGLDVVPVRVEVDLSNGLPGLTVVGLPDKSVDESRERVRSAIRASGYSLPAQRITVNLAPADVKKEGPAFDLPVAVGILAAAGQIPPPDERAMFVGELSLAGEIKPVKGMLAIALAAAERKATALFVPPGNAAEAAVVHGVQIFQAPTLSDLITHLSGGSSLSRARPVRPPLITTAPPEYDLADIKGQAHAKRALEIAAAGGHNVLLSGPPGTGKTLLARALPGILPPLSEEESLEVSKIYSVTGRLPAGMPLIRERPFRSPHHSISLPGLIGGGSWPRPGELSLAHRGVLFLDEIPLFPASVLESMRAPLEDRSIRISRAQHTLSFPADCILVASQNPCPCGFADDPVRPCTCSPVLVDRYQKKLSGPIRDRFDLTIDVPRVSYETINALGAETSAEVRRRVVEARGRQRERYGTPARTNAAMRLAELEQFAQPPPEAKGLLEQAVERWHVSVRGYHRILKVARTIADLEGAPQLTEPIVAEALQYRVKPAGVAA